MFCHGKQTVACGSGRKLEFSVRFGDAHSGEWAPSETAVARIVVAGDCGFAENLSIEQKTVVCPQVRTNPRRELSGIERAQRISQNGIEGRSFECLSRSRDCA